jgi:hypothetical protein
MERIADPSTASRAGGMTKGRVGVSIWGSVHGTPGQVAQIPGLKSETWGTFRFLPEEKLVIPHLTRLRRHQRMFYKGEVKWGNLKL